MATAILIDGAYFIKRIRHFEPNNYFNAQRIADLAVRCAMLHLSDKRKVKQELYRIFFYDCAPLEKKMHNPISKKAFDFSKSNEAIFRTELHQRLLKKRKLALRLGDLSQTVEWIIKPDIEQAILKGKRDLSKSPLQENDVIINTRQKGVDMRIGIDITTLALKKQVNQIVLIAGDSDFVPAAKLARREGVDFILDPIHQNIPDQLNEHIDGLRSTYFHKKKHDDLQEIILAEAVLNRVKMGKESLHSLADVEMELDLIYKMQNGLEETITHEEAMRNLRKVLKLDEN
ncbi:NYN domain-containing protein [Lonepinella sp. MS14435]|uniref:NYN domain-containing protein n=1 Tax=Lonepinella sp. MS14435 TaxID=3003618 RepID=UPI0036DE7563